MPIDRGFQTNWIPDLAFGVTIFFSLSGFLLYRPFAASVLDGRPLPRVRSYLWNRALRILPAYWVVLLLSAVVLETVAVRSAGDRIAGGLGDAPALLLSVVLVQNYFPDTVAIGIGPAWSLAVEAVFYLLLPGLALGAAFLARRGGLFADRRLAALAPAALLLLVGLTGKSFVAYGLPGAPGDFGTNWHSVAELSFWCQADLFAFGMALAVVYTEIERGHLGVPRFWRPIAAGGALGFGTIVVSATDWGDPLSYKPINTLMALACTLALALVVLPTATRSPQPLILRALELPVVVAVGLVSYGVFLWQEPLVFWLGERGLLLGGRVGLLTNSTLLLTVTLILSTATYLLVEAPSLRLKSRRVPRPVEPSRSPATSSVVR